MKKILKSKNYNFLRKRLKYSRKISKDLRFCNSRPIVFEFFLLFVASTVSSVPKTTSTNLTDQFNRKFCNLLYMYVHAPIKSAVILISPLILNAHIFEAIFCWIFRITKILDIPFHQNAIPSEYNELCRNYAAWRLIHISSNFFVNSIIVVSFWKLNVNVTLNFFKKMNYKWISVYQADKIKAHGMGMVGEHYTNWILSQTDIATQEFLENVM